MRSAIWKKKADRDEYIESGAITNDMISEITRGMEDMLDAIEELNDLMNELVSSPADMEPEDIDAMKIKHRNKEMKEITKADAEYLKAMFEHFEKVKSSGDMIMTGEGASFGGSTEAASPAFAIDVAL